MKYITLNEENPASGIHNVSLDNLEFTFDGHINTLMLTKLIESKLCNKTRKAFPNVTHQYHWEGVQRELCKTLEKFILRKVPYFKAAIHYDNTRSYTDSRKLYLADSNVVRRYLRFINYKLLKSGMCITIRADYVRPGTNTFRNIAELLGDQMRPDILLVYLAHDSSLGRYGYDVSRIAFHLESIKKAVLTLSREAIYINAR